MSEEYCAAHSKDRFYRVIGDICAGTPDLDGDGLTDGDKGQCHDALYDFQNDYDGTYWDWNWRSGFDGGAPLICAIEGKAVTVGIFSKPDNGCMEAGRPGAFASLNSGLSWIQQVTNEN